MENPNLTQFIYKVNEVIVNPLIILLFGIALISFFWGIFEFLSKSSSEEGRVRGKRNMVWGIIGMFIMFSVFGIINIILGTFGIQTPDIIQP